MKLISCLFFTALMASVSHAGDITLDYIGQRIIPHGYEFQDTVVGGLSSLDYDADTDRYLAICDDRSEKNPARFYGLKLNYDTAGFHGWQVISVDFMKQPNGTVFPKPGFSGKTYVDPEALRFSPEYNSYYWTSEGHAKYEVNPFIREMTLDGSYLRDFPVPEKYRVGEGKGIRDNMAFEALTVSADHQSILVSTEGPLIQDGQETDTAHGAHVRLLQFDIDTAKPIHEYAYAIEPVHKKILPFGNFFVNGVVDILALGDHQYIVVERLFSIGAGFSVKLYLANLTGATDVLDIDSLEGTRYQSVTKTLLLDLGELGITVDNIEGISFGKTLKDGRRSLLLISDDNFRSAQVTQILAFAINGLNP